METYTLGERIMDYRFAHNLSQREFAQKIGVTDVAVCKWEQGKNLPAWDKLAPLSEILGCSVSDLLESYPMYSTKK